MTPLEKILWRSTLDNLHAEKILKQKKMDDDHKEDLAVFMIPESLGRAYTAV